MTANLLEDRCAHLSPGVRAAITREAPPERPKVAPYWHGHANVRDYLRHLDRLARERAVREVTR